MLINAAPDINSYAVMNYVSEKYIAFTKFLMSRSCAYGVFNTYYLGSNNVWELAKEVKINKVEANVVGETVGELTSIKIGKEIYSIPNTSGFATEAFVRNAIAEAELNGKDVDFTVYATKDEIKDLASTIYVDEKIASIKIPDSDLYKVDFNAPNFTEANAAYKAGKVLVLANAAPDTSSYAIMNYVRDDIISFTKFLMSRSCTYGSFNTYYLHSDNTWELSKEVKLNKVDAITDANNNINGIVIGKNTYDFDNFATNETINQINQNIENIQDTYVTNETLEQKNYVTEQHVSNTYITAQQAAETYVTTEQIETKVTDVIDSKIEDGVITVNVDSISYDTW